MLLLATFNLAIRASLVPRRAFRSYRDQHNSNSQQRAIAVLILLCLILLVLESVFIYVKSQYTVTDRVFLIKTVYVFGFLFGVLIRSFVTVYLTYLIIHSIRKYPIRLDEVMFITSVSLIPESIAFIRFLPWLSEFGIWVNFMCQIWGVLLFVAGLHFFSGLRLDKAITYVIGLNIILYFIPMVFRGIEI